MISRWHHSLKSRAGNTATSVRRFFDIDKGDLDATAALGGRLQRGDVHVIGDSQAEVAVVQTHVRDQGIGGIGESPPESCIEIDGVVQVIIGVDGPGASQYDFVRAELVIEQAADIDGAG